MIRDAILKTKRDELTKCITSRKRKLQELYHATVSFARTEPVPLQHQLELEGPYNDNETTFLDANDISKGRFFSENTLPHDRTFNNSNGFVPSRPHSLSPTGGGHYKGQDVACGLDACPDSGSHGTTTTPDKSTAINGAIKSIPTSPYENYASSQPLRRSSRGAQTDPYIALSTTKGISTGQGQEIASSENSHSGVTAQAQTVTGEVLREPRSVDIDEAKSIIPSEALPLTTDDVDSMARSDVILASVKERPGPARTVHLPSKEVQERHLQQLDHNVQSESKGSQDGLHDTAEVVEDAGSWEQSAREVNARLAAIGDSGSLSLGEGIGNDLQSEDPDSVKDPSRSDPIDLENHTDNSHHQDSLLKSQLDVARKNAFATTPSTPDAQLRLEEAQFMKPPIKTPGTETLGSDHDPGQLAQHASEISPQHLHDRMDIDGQGTGEPADGDDAVSRQVEHNGDGIDRSIPRYTTSPQSRKYPGMTRDLSKDLMFSQRPPMRIDTDVGPMVNSSSLAKITPVERTSAQGVSSDHALSAASTPIKAISQTSPPERMTTRVSSGALRHKSVSEILGETPRVAHQGDRTPSETGGHNAGREVIDSQALRSAPLVTSPDSVTFRSRLSELREREKERSKLSTVVFARKQPSSGSRDLDPTSQLVESQNSSTESKDYLMSLFAAQASSMGRSIPLNKLLSSAHKTLTTSHHYLDFHEQQDGRILKRIYQLQNSNRWSLRQIERSAEPDRPATHWDALMGHMKWMRTDFREERKWKLATAKNFADWCAEWVVSPPDKRVLLQIRTRPGHSGMNVASEPTPELIPSGEDDSSDAMDDDTPPADVAKVSVPAAIFSLAPEDVLFDLDKTPVSEKLLSELPVYQPWIGPQIALPHISKLSSDNVWKTPVVPISKFTTGKMVIREQGPPRKKSRYHYVDEEDTQESHSSRLYLGADHTTDTLAPEQHDVALFNPENKHIRDRIHAGHAFRPPSEHNMPSQSFFESRQSSQWTWSEDDELRRLVREYAYNWSLISSCLSSPSMFSSGAERRTPWECFERWVSLEGLPADMSKTQYFKAYHSRLEAAQRTLVAQQQAAQQQQGNNAAQMPIRRRTALPVRVDRRKNNKHLALVHAMQKLAKKRETALQKQQHVASLAAMRKANEAPQPKAQMQTPQEFSRFKYERECKMQERAEAYRQQIIAQQRVLPPNITSPMPEADNGKAALQQKANLQSGQQQAGPSAPQLGRNPTSSVSNGASPSLASSLPNGHVPAGHPNSNRNVPPSQPIMNGVHMNASLPPNASMGVRSGGVPQAQMQSHLQGQQRMPSQVGPESMRIYMEANRVQQEQQRYLQQQRQQQHPQTNGQVGNSSSPNSGHLNLLSQNSSAVLANLQATSGLGSPSINGATGQPISSTSPGMSNAMQPQPLSSGMVPAVNHISNQIKARNPQASPEQVSKMTTESLNNYRMLQAQAAMSAAAGNNPSAGVNISNLPNPAQQQAMMNGVNGNSMLNPQVYAQMMRSQQSSQQNRSGGNGMNGVGPPSRSATPQIHRTGSGQAGANQSPRPPQAQMAGAQ